jgi:mannose-6-phosphate isomerase-like protein (cupin superfamily)
LDLARPFHDHRGMENRAYCEPLTPLDPLRVSQGIADNYDNRRIASVNDHEIRMSVMTRGFPWHRHPDSDETFCAIDGDLIIEFAHHQVVLKPGEFLTVPKGVLHRTRPSGKRSVNLTFEKLGAETVFE